MSQINNEMIHKLKYIKLFILIKASDDVKFDLI